MSISVSNNPYTPNYTTAVKTQKATGVFSIPEDQNLSGSEVSPPAGHSQIASDVSLSQELIFDSLRSKAQMLPDDIGIRGEQAIEYFETMMGPQLYEFHANAAGEVTNVTIKEGLSPEFQALAEEGLADMQPHKAGLSIQNDWEDYFRTKRIQAFGDKRMALIQESLADFLND